MSFCSRSLIRQGTQAPVGDTSGNPIAPQVSDLLYATMDAGATVETAGYFNNARGRLFLGDIIHAVVAHPGTVPGTPIRKGYVVTAVPATGNVLIAIATVTAG